MSELQGWVGIVVNVGLPLALVLWYVLYQQPRQEKRSDEREVARNAAHKEAIAEERKACIEDRAAERQHFMDISKVQAEVHRAVTAEFKAGLDMIGGKTENNGQRMDKLEDTFQQYRTTTDRYIEELRRKASG